MDLNHVSATANMSGVEGTYKAGDQLDFKISMQISPAAETLQ